MITVDSLGDDFPTFPQFQAMLQEYEAEMRSRQRTFDRAYADVIRKYPTEYDAARNDYRERYEKALHNASDYQATVPCMNCGHRFALAPNATDTWCATCAPKWRRHRAV